MSEWRKRQKQIEIPQMKMKSRKLLECRVCGNKFAPDKEQVYTARECISRGGINGALAGMKEPEVYDCYDCPVCGCQIVVQERLRGEWEEMNECLKLP